jgi:putative ABC transport system permease protein
MLRLALKGALARRLRLALTATSIVIGVAFVAGTYVLTDTLNATFDRLFGGAAKGVAVVVRGHESFQVNGFNAGPTEERALVPDSVLQEVRSVPGVKDAVGVASGYAQVVYKGKAVVNGGAPNIGTAWVGDKPESSLHLVKGQEPTAPGEILLDYKSADKYHVPVGAGVEVIASGQTLPATVVGYLRFGDSSLGGATITAFVPSQAQELLIGTKGSWSSVQASADPGVSQPVLKQRVQTALTDAGLSTGVVVQTEKAYTTDQADQVKSQLKFFNILLLVFAFISVFVAVFIIFNTFTVLVAQRTRELALLRALGASRRQVLSSVVIEAAIVGLVSGIIGIGLGLLVADGLRALLGVFGGSFDTVSLQLRTRTIIVSLLVGGLATMLAAIVPAIRATRIPPVAAMRDDFVLPTPSLRRRTRIGIVLLVIGGVLLVFGVKNGQALGIGLGALAMFRGVVSLSPVLSRPIVGGIGKVLPRIWGTTGRLARENALRNPKRTAATASALMIGIALTTTMSVMAASITSSANAAIDKSVGADFIITADNFAPISTSVATQARQVAGVGDVTEFRAGAMKVHNSTKQVQGVTSDTVVDTLRLDVTSGSADDVASGNVLISEKTAEDNNWHVGSSIPVEFSLTGKQSLRVQGIFAKNPIAGDYLIGLETYNANYRNRLDQVVALTVAPDANVGQVRTNLNAALKNNPSLKLQDQTEFKQDQKRQINQVLAFVLALLVLSLLIAWLGIVNTLALSVFERTREIGLLRAVGMRFGQVFGMIVLEAVVIALFGALLGVALGLGYGAALVQALHSQGIDTTSFPVGQLIGYLVVGAIAGVTAALWPARRASKLNVLQAISTTE